MKKLFLYGLLLVPLLSISQGKSIFSSMLVTPKNDQALNFENSLKPHVAKFHGPDHQQIVFQIISGPNTGSYQIVEGPYSWDEMDKMPPSQAHFEDVQLNLASKTEKNHGRVFSVLVDSLSFGTTNRRVEKSRVNILTIKSGQLSTVLDLYSKLKKGAIKVGADTKRNVTVYVKLLEDIAGSHPQIITIRRFPTGWKEMEDGFAMTTKDIITQAYSADYWQEWLKAISASVESSESFLRVYRADLSSK